MGNSSTSSPLRYKARADPKVYERCYRMGARRHLRQWIRYACTQMWTTCSISLGGYLVGQMFGGKVTNEGVIAAVLFGVLLGPLVALQQYDKMINQSLAEMSGMSWDCELTTDYYQFEDPNGVLTCIPWSSMEVEATDSEYWVITYGSNELIVFREPLRKAGLESEFARRAGHTENVVGKSG